MSGTPTCARDVRKPALDPCPECGATEGEACPLDDLSPSLLTGSAIGAAKGGECNGDDGVCEACQ